MGEYKRVTYPSLPSSEHELWFASTTEPAACDDCDVPMNDALIGISDDSPTGCDVLGSKLYFAPPTVSPGPLGIVRD